MFFQHAIQGAIFFYFDFSDLEMKFYFKLIIDHSFGEDSLTKFNLISTGSMFIMTILQFKFFLHNSINRRINCSCKLQLIMDKKIRIGESKPSNSSLLMFNVPPLGWKENTFSVSFKTSRFNPLRLVSFILFMNQVGPYRFFSMSHL